MNYQLITQKNEFFTPVEQILTNRGIPDIEHYLNVTKKDNLSPQLFPTINKAVQLLIKHLDNPKSYITVIVDSDCDGYCSSALLLNYIYSRWQSAISKITYLLHDSKIHGIEIDKIPEETTLLIVPDASSNEYDIHQQLVEKGIDILILDHHHADKISKYACVVNNQLCDYPTKSLCGCGIVYKFCQRIDEYLGEEGFVDYFLDIVACSEIGDMMDLRDYETHYLVQEGLAHLKNPFIKGMAEKNAYSIGNEITPIGVAFYIVPLINSITRVGTMEEKTLLFESMLEWKANELIPSTKRGCGGQIETLLEQSLRTCTNVKNRQTRDQDAAVEQIKKVIKEQNLLNHKVLLIQLTELSFDRNIVGLIANKLMAEYQRPTILLVKSEYNGKLAWSGSARACGIDDFRQFCDDSGLIYLAQGHPSAFGCGILDERVNDFIKLCDQEFKNKDFSPSYKVDFIYSGYNVKPQDILDIGSMKCLWGQCISEPLVVVENLSITRDMLQLMSRDKNPTLKISLPNGISCIKFKSGEEEYDNLYSEGGCVTVNIVGKCEVNKYYDKVTPQLIIVDYEIISKQDYYF